MHSTPPGWATHHRWRDGGRSRGGRPSLRRPGGRRHPAGGREYCCSGILVIGLGVIGLGGARRRALGPAGVGHQSEGRCKRTDPDPADDAVGGRASPGCGVARVRGHSRRLHGRRAGSLSGSGPGAHASAVSDQAGGRRVWLVGPDLLHHQRAHARPRRLDRGAVGPGRSSRCSCSPSCWVRGVPAVAFPRRAEPAAPGRSLHSSRPRRCRSSSRRARSAPRWGCSIRQRRQAWSPQASCQC